MANVSRRLLVALSAAFLLLAVPTAQASDKKFVDSDDAKEKDEPQKFLPDYDKLVKGKDADWVYFPDGSLSKYKTASVKEFDHNGHGPSAARRRATARTTWSSGSRSRASRWSSRAATSSVEGNVFNAWEPTVRRATGAAGRPTRASGLELLVKDSKGNVVGELRQKAKGSTIRDAVENGLEDMAKAIVDGASKFPPGIETKPLLTETFSIATGAPGRGARPRRGTVCPFKELHRFLTPPTPSPCPKPG